MSLYKVTLSHHCINVTPKAELGFYIEGNHDQHMKSLKLSL